MEKSINFFGMKKYLKPSWFGIPILLNKNLLKKKIYLKKLNNGIDARPIISGIF